MIFRVLILITAISTCALAQDLSTTNVADQESSIAYVSASGTTVDDLVRRMFSNNLELQAARQRLEQARGRLLQAGLRLNPRIEFQNKSDRFISNQGRREDELTFVQPLEIGGKRRLRMNVAEKEVERISFEVADLERQRVSELESLIAQAFTEAARIRAMYRIERLNENLKNATEVRIRAGDASEYEFVQVQSESARLEIDRQAIANHLDELMLQIKTIAGIPMTETVRLRDVQFQAEDINITLGEALRLAIDNRPDLKAARMVEEEAEAKIKLARRESIPDIGAILGFKRNATVSPAPIQSTDWQLKLGVSITIPIFNRNQGVVSENAAVLTEARLHRENLEQIITRDVTIAMKRLDQVRRNMEMYKNRLVPVAQRSVEMAKLGFDMGELRLAEYLNEQRRLAEIESSYAQARADLFRAQVEVERAIGKPVR
jgi:outer membrane protein, heavy metal efflux system